MNKLTAHQQIFLGIAGLLLIAILPLPYALYTPLNLVVALAGGLLIAIGVKSGNPLWAVPGAAAVILYLPAFNQGFDKATWIVVDLIFIPIFVVAGLTIKGRVLEAWIRSGD